MIKLECDDCHKPIAGHDNHLEIPHLILIENRQVAHVHNLHCCGQKCLTSWLVKNCNRPQILSAQ